jgi:hypothetical protein
MLRLRLVVLLCLCFVLFSVQEFVSAQGSGQGEVIIDAVVPGCGNAIVEAGEECDGGALAGQSCFTKGFTSGTLSCTASCTFNASLCVYTPPTQSSSSGGGGSSSRGAQVVLTGRAYPKSEVTVLKDAQVVATTIADESSNFQVLVKGLSAGTYIFSLYGEDKNGVRSSLFTFPVTVTRGILAKIDSIFVAPTLTGNKIEVKKGEPITFFGQSVPESFITIEVNSNETHFSKVSADRDGVYLYNFDSSLLELGQHHARSRSVAEEIISSQSAAYEFQVGNKDVFTKSETCSPKADLNKDCRVNLVDFSIVAFWYLRPLTPAFTLREAEHLNGDGKVNLIDFSIMAFYWTG